MGSPGVQEHALAALLALLFTEETVAKGLILGALEAVIAALQRHGSDPFVTEQAMGCCAALTVLPEPRRSALRMGVAGLVAGALRAHAGSPRAAAAACSAAAVLATPPGLASASQAPPPATEDGPRVSEELKLLLLSKGAVAALCELLDQFSALQDGGQPGGGGGGTEKKGGAEGADKGADGQAAQPAFRPSPEDFKSAQFRCGATPRSHMLSSEPAFNRAGCGACSQFLRRLTCVSPSLRSAALRSCLLALVALSDESSVSADMPVAQTGPAHALFSALRSQAAHAGVQRALLALLPRILADPFLAPAAREAAEVLGAADIVTEAMRVHSSCGEVTELGAAALAALGAPAPQIEGAAEAVIRGVIITVQDAVEAEDPVQVAAALWPLLALVGSSSVHRAFALGEGAAESAVAVLTTFPESPVAHGRALFALHELCGGAAEGARHVVEAGGLEAAVGSLACFRDLPFIQELARVPKATHIPENVQQSLCLTRAAARSLTVAPEERPIPPGPCRRAASWRRSASTTRASSAPPRRAPSPPPPPPCSSTARTSACSATASPPSRLPSPLTRRRRAPRA